MLPSAVHRVAASGPIKSAIGIIASNELKHTTTTIRHAYDTVGAASARMTQRTAALGRYGDQIVQRVKQGPREPTGPEARGTGSVCAAHAVVREACDRGGPARGTGDAALHDPAPCLKCLRCVWCGKCLRCMCSLSVMCWDTIP